MKKYLHLEHLLLVAVLLLTITSCKKGIKDPVTLDKAAGQWDIHAIRYTISYGTSNTKDSTVPWKPVVKNYVTFDGISRLEYCFNASTATGGEYQFVSADSIDLQIGNEKHRWKIDLLTNTNFNIERTSTDNNAFPGATVVTYQGFIR